MNDRSSDLNWAPRHPPQGPHQDHGRSNLMVSKYYHHIKISICLVEYGIKYLVHGVSLLAIVVVSFVTYMIFDGHSSIKM